MAIDEKKILIDAPVGLFMYDGIMGFKTEYMTNGFVEAFVVESGEYFWGGVKTSEERNNLEVTPIEAEPVVYGKWKWDENAIDWGLGAWVCSQCHSTNENIHAKKDENPLLWRGSQRCPVCGAKMNRKGK